MKKAFRCCVEPTIFQFIIYFSIFGQLMSQLILIFQHCTWVWNVLQLKSCGWSALWIQWLLDLTELFVTTSTIKTFPRYCLVKTIKALKIPSYYNKRFILESSPNYFETIHTVICCYNFFVLSWYLVGAETLFTIDFGLFYT